MGTQFVQTSVLAPSQVETRPIVLQTLQLTRKYGERTVVNSLNLEVFRGDIFGFLGPNGAGKTTTIRMILGLIAPDAGSIRLFGEDMATTRATVLPRVGALIETPALYLHTSARNNLRAIGATLGGVSEQRIDELLDLLDLRTRQHDRVGTYSLGMKQRLGIAIALLQDPELLILDEPTNGLDPAGIVEMRDLLRRLADGGKTIFISSHILAEVQQICKRVAILSRGQLVKEARVDDLVNEHSLYAVRTERVGEALALVRQQMWGQTAYIDNEGTLVTGAPNRRPHDLSLFLIQMGFIPELLMPKERNLERIFLDLTEQGSEK